MTTDKSELVDYVIKPIPEVLGRKYGRLFPAIQEAIAKLDVQEAVNVLKMGESLTLTIDGQEIRILPEEVRVVEQPRSGYSISEEDNIVVGVNIMIPESLKMEGLARDIVRRIQNQRKEAGFNIADNIETYYEAGPILTEVFENFGEYIAAETLSIVIRRGSPQGEAHLATYNLAGETLKIWLRRAGA